MTRRMVINTYDKGILRVIDANFNRCKEGLRVVEDIFRFILQDDRLRIKIRNIRHSLDRIVKNEIVREAILTRDSNKDLGRKVDRWELKRTNIRQLLYINFQRVKESLRVMEEFFKLTTSKKVASIKKMRYRIYDMEKETQQRWPALCNFRYRHLKKK